MLATAYRVQVPISFTHSRLSGTGRVRPWRRDLSHRGRPRGVLDAAHRDDLRVQAAARRALAPEAAGQRARAHRRGRPLQRRALPHRQGQSSAYMLRPVDRVEALDRYTVKFTLKEPFAWFLDMLASPMATAIVARECVDAFGDLKKPESVVGTGPWMLDSYRPGRASPSSGTPATSFRPALHRPHRDRRRRGQRLPDGRFPRRQVRPRLGIPRRDRAADWTQIKDALRERRPRLRTAEFPSNVVSCTCRCGRTGRRSPTRACARRCPWPSIARG